MKLYAPVIRGMTGPVRSEIIVDRNATTTASLGDRAQIPYAVADQATATLTVRDHPTGPDTDDHRATSGNSMPKAPALSTRRASNRAGFTKWCTRARIPRSPGLGPAAVRDYISYMKEHGEVKRQPSASALRKADASCASFSTTASMPTSRATKVFDGLWAHVGGAGRGSFNHRFAQPSRDGHTWMNFPLSHGSVPVHRRTGNRRRHHRRMLARAKKDGVVPKIFYTNGSYEYWGRDAGADPHQPGWQEGCSRRRPTRASIIWPARSMAPTRSPKRQDTQNRANPHGLSVRDARAAGRHERLDHQWNCAARVADSARRQGSIGDDRALWRFRRSPAWRFPKTRTSRWRLDFGPDFATKGIVAYEPPKIGEGVSSAGSASGSRWQ